MQYMLLIYNGDPGRWERMSEDERKAIYAEYGALTQELRDRNALVDGNELQPTSTATAVRVRDGQTTVTDGPFAETKEALGGYYVVDVESLDEAIELAAKIPSARHSVVEIRPVVMRAAEVSA
jgi:hypothetical protein